MLPAVVDTGRDILRERIKLSKIKADPTAQPRASLFPDRVAEYVDDMGRGDKFPPLIVFRDKEGTCWLADGFHRYHAAIGLELKTIECEVRRGGLRDAVLYSCGANAEHGLRRSNDDKRQAVSKLLKDEEWSKWSDREIARRCRVDHEMVGRMRTKLAPVTGGNASEPRTYRTKHGTTAKMSTGRIGKTAPAADEQQPSLQLDRPPAPPPEPSQIEKDNANGWISSALWEVQRRIDSLPPPEEAARLFPSHHRHTMSSDKLRQMAAWLNDFAQAWSTRQQELGNGKEARTAA